MFCEQNGLEDLDNCGPFAGVTYTCQVAPVDAPEQVATALVSQTLYQKVRDDFAVYYFKAAAEAPVLALCEAKDYVLNQRISLEMPWTAQTWTADDSLKEDLYRKDYTSEAAFKRGLASYIEFYNTQRPHRTLKNQTPCQVEGLFVSNSQ